MTDELKVEYEGTKEQQEDQKEDNIIELRDMLQTLLDTRFPIKQGLDQVDHEIAMIKLRIQNANTRYFQNKGL